MTLWKKITLRTQLFYLNCNSVYKYHKELKSVNINAIIQNKKDISGAPGCLSLLSVGLWIPAQVMISGW